MVLYELVVAEAIDGVSDTRKGMCLDNDGFDQQVLDNYIAAIFLRCITGAENSGYTWRNG